MKKNNSSIIKTPFEIEREYRQAVRIHNYFSKIREHYVSRDIPRVVLKLDGTLEIKQSEMVEKIIQYINEKEEEILKNFKINVS